MRIRSRYDCRIRNSQEEGTIVDNDARDGEQRAEGSKRAWTSPEIVEVGSVLEVTEGHPTGANNERTVPTTYYELEEPAPTPTPTPTPKPTPTPSPNQEPEAES